jgi:hypothetical protein
VTHLAIAKRGAKDVARRSHETTSQIFRYAIAHGYAKRNPAADFKPSDIIIKPASGNFGPRGREGNSGIAGCNKQLQRNRHHQVCDATTCLYLGSHLGADRSGVAGVRSGQGTLGDPQRTFEDGHAAYRTVVTATVEVLRALKMLTGNGRLLSPGDLDKSKPMSSNTPFEGA